MEREFLKPFYILIVTLLAFLSCESASEKAYRLNREAIIQRITFYMEDPANLLDVSDYTPYYYSELDTLTDYWIEPGKPAKYHLIHKYKGGNNASRWVKRSASVFFNEGLSVVDVKTILYHNPMHKDTLKARLRGSDWKP